MEPSGLPMNMVCIFTQSVCGHGEMNTVLQQSGAAFLGNIALESNSDNIWPLVTNEEV